MSSKLKMILVGDSLCGKTSLLQQFVHKRFFPGQDMTIGVDLFFKILSLHNKHLKLQIWDTAGQEMFHTITRMYYRGSHVILLVYDITNVDSFVHIQSWIQRIQDVWKEDYSPIMILVGNKSDQSNDRAVSQEEAEAFALLHNMLFVETSAKTGNGVEDAFLLPTSSFIKQHIDLLEEIETPIDMDSSYDSQSACCWL